MKTKILFFFVLLALRVAHAEIVTFTPSENKEFSTETVFNLGNEVMMTISKGRMSPEMLTLYNEGATLTFSSTEAINTIHLIMVEGDPADRITGTGYVASGETGIWKGNTNEVVLTNNANDWIGIKEIKIATGSSVLTDPITDMDYLNYTFYCNGEINNTDSLVVETDVATFIQNKGTGQNAPAYVNPWRIYTGNTVTIRMKNDFVLKKVEISVTAYNSSDPELDYSTSVTESYTNNIKTISELPYDIYQLTMTNKGSQTRWDKMTIYYCMSDEQNEDITAIVSPRSVDFGTFGTKNRISRNITIISKKDCQIISADIAEPFAISNSATLPVSLTSNQSYTLELCAEPQTEGTFNDILTVTLTDTAFQIPVTATATNVLPVAEKVYMNLPKASHFYDFNNEGSKGFAYTENGVMKTTKSQLQEYADDKTLNKYLNPIDYIADINGDGYPDFSTIPYTTGGNWLYGGMLLSNSDTNYDYLSSAWFLPGMDLNSDGRLDYLSYEKKSSRIGAYTTYTNTLAIHSQTANKTFIKQSVYSMTQNEYEMQFDPNAWYENNSSDGISSVIPGNFGFSGFCGTNCGGGSTDYTLPTQSLDLDGDGRIDLLDEINGKILYNKGDQTAIYTAGGGFMQSCDLNGDGYADFVGFYDGQLISVIYRGNGNYEQTVIFENPVVDNKYYCYDIDKDGDIDLLVTLSYAYNGMASYVVPFLNDGNGNFTQYQESYFPQNLLFKNMQDINGDGHMDLLAFEGKLEENLIEESFDTIYVVYMTGSQTGLFDEPQRIMTIPTHTRYLDEATINAADIDNDGLIEIWTSEIDESRDNTEIYKLATATPNKAPTTPTKPFVSLNNSTLQVTWESSTDDHTSACDLTYSLRIGTAPGKNDIMDGGATASGVRRGFYDGNMQRNRTYTMDFSTMSPGTYYVAVQAVDAQHNGSAWSEESIFENTIVPDFTIDKTDNLTYADTICIHYTLLPDDYTTQWDLDNATIVSETEGCKTITFGDCGTKTISLLITAPDGKQTKYSKNLTFAPNYVGGNNTNNEYIEGNFSYLRHYADYNADGFLDAAKTDGVYINNGTGGLSKATALWNSGLSFGDFGDYAWLDYDRNGYIDLIYLGNDISSGYLANNGNGTFTKKTDSNVQNWFDSESEIAAAFNVDWNNDGLVDAYYNYYDGTTQKIYFQKNNGDGTFTTVVPNGITETTLYDEMIADFNRDGYMDIFAYIWSGSGNRQYINGLEIMLNRGNFTFERMEIPFAEPIMSSFDGYNFQAPCLVDMNADGYLDLVALRESDEQKAFYILYNQQNKAFSEPTFVQLENHVSYKENENFFYDIDNNGYIDIIGIAYTPSEEYGWYAVYFDENGAGEQSFLSKSNNYHSWSLDMDANGLPDLNLHNTTSSGITEYTGTLKSCLPNQRPSVPTSITAQQTESGLLVTWEPAADDHTPYAAMRYNLSVKRKGQTGANAYIISPQNGGNADMAALPTQPWWTREGKLPYHYLSATQFEIPLNILTANEELEISVQSIDLWNAISEFSTKLDYKVGATADITAPASTCIGSVTNISYNGTYSTETPIWDFSGATVISGSGFGPYEVYWQTEGPKQIHLTLGTESTYVTVNVNAELDATIEVADYVQYNVDTEIVLPQVSPNATFKWLIEVGTGTGFVETYDNSFGSNIIINAIPGNKHGTIRICRDPEVPQRRLQLTVSYNGCESVYQTQTINLINENETPKITYVTPDENANNVIYWESSSLPAEVTDIRILKETSYYNEFETLDEVPAGTGSYTDALSNSTVKSERYRIQSLYGTDAGPASDIHKTVHLTINKAQYDGQFNLIWSGYEGREVATYHILRGTTPDNLTTLASVASSNTSYLDLNAGTEDVYYAIEYDLYTDAYQQRTTSTYTGRSNVVCSNNAINTILATSLEIQSLNGLFETTQENRTLYLFAELFPANATYKTAHWEIIDGSDYATINTNGILTAINGNSGGYVTVKATTIDGTNISATKRIYIEALKDDENEENPDLYIFGDAIPGSSWAVPLVSPYKLTNNNNGTYSTLLSTNGGYFSLVAANALECSDWTCLNNNQYVPETDGTDITNTMVSFTQAQTGFAFFIQQGTYNLHIDLTSMTISSIGQTDLNKTNATTCQISSKDRWLIVNNSTGSNIRIYNALGQLVIQTKAQKDTESFLMPTAGIYIVKAGDVVAKVLLQ